MRVVHTRREAQELGLKRYYSGEPCSNGHDSDRYAHGQCIECARLFYEAKKESVKAAAKQRYERKREEIIFAVKNYAKQNVEKIKNYQSAYRAENKNKHQKYLKDWRKKNPESKALDSAKRKAQFLLRTPDWLTDSDLDRIRNKYKEARWMTQRSGVKHEVDHFYPLQGKLVSGLHVPENLRVIPAHVNNKKNARTPTVERAPL